MFKLKSAIFGIIATTVLTSCTGAPPKAKTGPLTCQVSLGSQDVGRINISRIDPAGGMPIAVPLQVGWHPPASGSTIDLAVGYGIDFKEFGPPSGGHAKFTSYQCANPEQYEAVVSVEDVQIARFLPPDIVVGAYNSAVTFSENQPNSRAVLAAIASGKHIKIDILAAGKSIASETFDTSATTNRDKFLAEAQHLVETSDPKVCRPI